MASKPHSSIDWAGTLEGHIILNIDEPYKTPALKALAGLVAQLEELNQMALHEIRRADEAEEQFKVEYGRGFADAGEQCKGLEEQLEASQKALRDILALDPRLTHDGYDRDDLSHYEDEVYAIAEAASSPASRPLDKTLAQIKPGTGIAYERSSEDASGRAGGTEPIHGREASRGAKRFDSAHVPPAPSPANSHYCIGPDCPDCMPDPASTRERD